MATDLETDARPMDLYEALGLSPGADAEAIEAAYRRILADETIDTDAGRLRLRAADDAYQVLSNVARRTEYDRIRSRPPVVAAEKPRRTSARDIVANAWETLTGHPRALLLPMLVVYAPVAFVMSAVTAVLYLTVFEDEPLLSVNDVASEAADGPFLALLLIGAVQVLFAQVGRGATIAAVAAVTEGKPKRLSEVLDPAFTRMGGLILLAAVFIAIAFLLIASVVGIVILPFLFLRTGVCFEAYMLEGVSAWAALRRSWGLMAGSSLRLLWALLVFTLFAIGPVLAISALGAIAGGSRTAEVLSTSALGFLQSVLLTPVIVFFTAITTLFYLDLRRGNDARPAA